MCAPCIAHGAQGRRPYRTGMTEAPIGCSQPLLGDSHRPPLLHPPCWMQAAPRANGSRSQPKPFLKSPKTFLKSIKKDFIKTNGSPGAPPRVSTCVCIAKGAAPLLPTPAMGAHAGQARGTNRDGSLGPAGATPLWSRGVSVGGSLTGSTWVSCGVLTGTGRSRCC